ncbi:lytic transglycosylase domain-containing protein [Halopseudomonas salegens]|uniref:Transglycosylase SLT domain-containing protein n=1 Tax=Halopseudomonas salegens TaxID=1434072 RepID=A0A1H2G2C8_9GAMM|nr:lytic transglycosylase domain-containing protein [Halopseudomonas salegens]SDU13677.1 Transglycosylase SLT domain-containing protein [Halopseudomonas salegens]
MKRPWTRLALPRWLLAGTLLCLCAPLSAQSASGTATETVDPQLRALLTEAVNSADSFSDRFEAEVWLLDMSTRMRRFIPDEAERLDFLRMVHREARRAELKPDMVIAVIHAESLFDRFALSSVGAQGVMQVMPFWKNEIGRPDDNLMDLATNLRYGCTILRFYLDKEKGNLRRALARYNGSLGSPRYPDRVTDYWYRFWYVND